MERRFKQKISQARPFFCYTSTIIGLIINYMTPINPIQILIYAATINGIFSSNTLIFNNENGNDKDISIIELVDGFLILLLSLLL